MSEPVKTLTMERFIRALALFDSLGMQELVAAGVMREGQFASLGVLRRAPVLGFQRNTAEAPCLWALIEERL